MLAATRPARLAGTWYADDPQVLAAQIDAWLAEARIPPLPGEVVGLVAPHAGHIYSGPVAAHAYRAVQGKGYERVVLIGPSHYFYTDRPVLPAYRRWSTPLGEVPADLEGMRRLAEALPVQEVVGEQEHALEIHLPFLQRALAPGFRLLPLMLGDHPYEELVDLAAVLAEVAREGPTLLVASSDLSHYYPDELARKVDAGTLQAILAFDPEALYRLGGAGKAEACGLQPIVAVQLTARALGATQAILLKHATSADTAGDPYRVVGYGAVAMVRGGTP